MGGSQLPRGFCQRILPLVGTPFLFGIVMVVVVTVWVRIVVNPIGGVDDLKVMKEV